MYIMNSLNFNFHDNFLKEIANLSVLSISLEVMPSSVDECPASKTMCSSASGHS